MRTGQLLVGIAWVVIVSLEGDPDMARMDERGYR